MTDTSESDRSFIAAALPAFISEAQEQIAGIEQLLLQLEDAPGNRELLDALFRCAHTVKGSAGIFGLDGVVAFTHHVETLLDRLRDGRMALDPALSTLLLQCNDEIAALVDAAESSDPSVAARASNREALIARLQAAGGGTAAAAPAAAGLVADDNAGASSSAGGLWQIAVRFGAETFRNGMDPLGTLNYLRGFGTIEGIVCASEAVPALEALDAESCHLGFAFGFETAATREEIEAAFSFVRDDIELEIVAPPAAAAASVATALAVESIAREASVSAPPDALAAKPAVRSKDASAAAPPDEQRFIRVQADRLDAVINLLGELVIAGAGAALLARQTRQGTLIEAHLQIGRLIEEIRNGTLQLRMVPIGETFARFRRVVRDTAAELGKDVALEIVGGETELDKSVVERIADPLMHLVRNALDHGLEGPDERTGNGKTAQGKLTLSACHESGGILIRIDDDGRGIDQQKVLARAWERGLVERGVVPPEADVLRLIFEPGFSTAEKVTNLSGRGVGMDVVRRNIEALRGTVSVFSTPGRGSRVEIRLPLTLAIIDGFLVGVGNSRFIFPLEAVVEVIETRPSDAAVDSRGRSIVELRGQVLPVVSLRALYGLGGDEPERSSMVVIKAGSRSYGVVVDQLLGQHQTVIKPLGRMFKSLRGMSGSSILGNGDVALIFDVHSLSQLATEAPAPARRNEPVSLEGHLS